MVHVFVRFVLVIVERFSIHRFWQIHLSLWLNMENTLFSYNLSSCTFFAVDLQLWLRSIAIH